MKRDRYFRDTLSAWLSEPGRTKSALARTVGISRSHLDKILSGETVPSLALADSIADAIGSTLEQMIAKEKLSNPC